MIIRDSSLALVLVYVIVMPFKAVLIGSGPSNHSILAFSGRWCLWLKLHHSVTESLTDANCISLAVSEIAANKTFQLNVGIEVDMYICLR